MVRHPSVLFQWIIHNLSSFYFRFLILDEHTVLFVLDQASFVSKEFKTTFLNFSCFEYKWESNTIKGKNE
jgi:hypothetical protein